MAARRANLARQFDHLRRAVVCEPRGHAAIVGAVLMPPVTTGSVAGVVFFNNVGYLGMCGHGLMGVMRTLQYVGRLGRGEARLDTPVGTVSAVLGGAGTVTVRNVPARCHDLDVTLEVPGVGEVRGDVAWGGNWFFLTSLPEPPLELAHVGRLLSATRQIRTALDRARLLGPEARIDHVELSGPATDPTADSRNFVLCPGGEYDRSPCGTGTAAKMAVLHARGTLAVGQEWRQESITGGRFVGWLSQEGGKLIPHIRGRAWITGRSTLVFDPEDPFRGGLAGG